MHKQPTATANTCTGATTTTKYALTVNKAFRPDATPTIAITITSNQSFTSGSGTDQVTYNRGSVTAMDKVKPEVVEQRTKITGPNTIVIVYEEAVTATLADYTELRVGKTGALNARNIHQTISGSGTDTHMLTFLGAEAETFFTGSIKVNDTLEDLAKNPFVTKTHTLEDGQSPILKLVLVTGRNMINATWTEKVFTPDSNGMKPSSATKPDADSFDGVRLSGVPTSTNINIAVGAPSNACDMPGKRARIY